MNECDRPLATNSVGKSFAQASDDIDFKPPKYEASIPNFKSGLGGLTGTELVRTHAPASILAALPSRYPKIVH